MLLCSTVCGCVRVRPISKGVGTVCLGHDASHPICAVMCPLLDEAIGDLVVFALTPAWLSTESMFHLVPY